MMNVGKRNNSMLIAGLLSAALALPEVPMAPLLAGGAVAFGSLIASVEMSEARGRGGQARVSSNHSGHRNVNRNTNRNVNRNTNRNVDVNRNINRNVNVDADWDNHHHPVARGAAFGAAAAVTAAAVGSIVYSLPGGCVTSYYGGVAYRECGGVWYAPQYQGSQVVYVVVNQP